MYLLNAGATKELVANYFLLHVAHILFCSLHLLGTQNQGKGIVGINLLGWKSVKSCENLTEPSVFKVYNTYLVKCALKIRRHPHTYHVDTVCTARFCCSSGLQRNARKKLSFLRDDAVWSVLWRSLEVRYGDISSFKREVNPHASLLPAHLGLLLCTPFC